VRALRSVADARDTQPAALGPLTDSVSRRTTDPKVPTATGTRKRATKCVRGPPEPGFTDTFVDGPGLAAWAPVAPATTTAAVARARPSTPRSRGVQLRIELDLSITSPPLQWL
jgi:hypothetical protein